MSWRERAACRGTADPAEFFPADREWWEAADRWCQRCPVTVDCLAEAIAHDETFGVWGGMSESARRRLQRLLREHKRYRWLPVPVEHPSRPSAGLRRSERVVERRRMLADELARNGGRLPRGGARRLAERFGVSEASVSLDLKWVHEQEVSA